MSNSKIRAKIGGNNNRRRHRTVGVTIRCAWNIGRKMLLGKSQQQTLERNIPTAKSIEGIEERKFKSSSRSSPNRRSVHVGSGFLWSMIVI